MATEIEKIKQELAVLRTEKDQAVAQLANAEKERDDALALLGTTAKSNDLETATQMIEELTKKLALQEAISGNNKPSFEVEGITYVINVPKLMVKVGSQVSEVSATDLASKEELADCRADLVAKKVGVISAINLAE